RDRLEGRALARPPPGNKKKGTGNMTDRVSRRGTAQKKQEEPPHKANRRSSADEQPGFPNSAQRARPMRLRCHGRRPMAVNIWPGCLHRDKISMNFDAAVARRRAAAETGLSR